MKKYLILIASVLFHLCLGAHYAWSTFVPTLKQNFGLTTAETQTIFGATLLSITVLFYAGGRILDRFGPRLPALAGGIIFGLSYIMASHSGGSYPALLLLIGIGAGAGVGLCYICPIACVVKWFPRQQSLVTGIVVAGYGGSAMIISRLGEYFLAQQVNVLTIFNYLGCGFLLITTAAAAFLQNPPRSESASASPAPKIKTLDLLKDRNFCGLLCGIFPALSIGMMTIGNLKPLGISLNLDWAVAGAAVGIFSIFNVLGRIGWGIIGGLVKLKRLILISIISTSIVTLGLPLVVSGTASFYLFVILAAFNFAACFVLYAAEIAAHYGTEKMGTVYSTLFVSQGLAGFLAPPLAGKIYDTVGSYTPAFLLFGVISFISIFLFFFIYQPERVSK